MNLVIMSGRATADPKSGKTAGGTAYAQFSIAVDRPRRNNEEKAADFFDCTAFGNNADFIIKHMRKGARIELKGRLQITTYIDSENIKRKAVRIIVGSQYEDFTLYDYAEDKQEAFDKKTMDSLENAGIYPLDFDEMDVPFK